MTVRRTATTLAGSERTPEEDLHLGIKLVLASAVRAGRTRLRLADAQLVERPGSSRSRVAEIEAGDRSVSLDLLVRARIELGATRRELARVLGQPA
jgi:transcriptional regulator with XRE-family HTH domain